MNRIIVILCILSLAILTACDVRSETARREMEKYTSTPEPARSPTPEASPIDPADSVAVDTNLDGGTIIVDGMQEKKTANCTKYDRVMVNGDKNVVSIKGVCSRLMVNGDGNEVKLDAATEFVLNGTENSVMYTRYANGKRPIVVENKAGNFIEKTTAAAQPNAKTKK